MEFMLVPVPIFDQYVSVEMYLFRCQSARQEPAAQADSPPLDVLESVGAEAFSGGRPIFVPIAVHMLGALLNRGVNLPSITVFLLEDHTKATATHLKHILSLRQKGYSFAVTQTDRFIDHDALLKLCDYVLFAKEAMANSDRRAMIIRYVSMFKQIRVIATNLLDAHMFQSAKKDGFHFFEGMFYRVPVTRQDQELMPIKVNLIRLLNLVRDVNFEFKDIAQIMRRDPALSYSLMRFINSPYLGIKYKVKSIQHAVTILGQLEVRKWITAAVFKALGSDRPSELTRISLIRAKFAENLSTAFRISSQAPSLFLMGLFSALDIMLSISMTEALDQVMVSDEIAEALIDGTGPLVTVLEYIIDYEKADWTAVLHHNEVQRVNASEVYTAYIDAMGWYNELLNEKVRYVKHPQHPQVVPF